MQGEGRERLAESPDDRIVGWGWRLWLGRFQGRASWAGPGSKDPTGVGSEPIGINTIIMFMHFNFHLFTFSRYYLDLDRRRVLPCP